MALVYRAQPFSGKTEGRSLYMSVARVTEISAISPESFEAAINEGITRATSTLRGVQSAWIKDMNVVLEDGQVSGYQVNMAVTFVLEEG
jgi:flavin-binding protein dodecin